MSHVSKNDYFAWEMAATGKLHELAFDGKNVIDDKKFLGLGSLGGVTQMETTQVAETGKTVVTFSTEDNMEVHGDLEVKGDLHVDGVLVVHGEITADFLHTGQDGEEDAAEEPAEDEVLLTPQELAVIRIGLDQLQYKHLSRNLGISIKAAQKLVQEIYEKLID